MTNDNFYRIYTRNISYSSSIFSLLSVKIILTVVLVNCDIKPNNNVLYELKDDEMTTFSQGLTYWSPNRTQPSLLIV